MYKDIRAAVVGSINMDIILNMQKVPEIGENVLGTSYGYACGGKGANQATGLARLGAQTKMIGKVADDANGRKLIENLRNNNIDSSFISTDGTQTGMAAIIIDGEGRNRIIVYEGSNAEMDPQKSADAIDDETDILLVQFETSEDVVVKCVNKAVSKGILTVIDCGPAKNFNLERMPGATIISPNENETEALSGIFPSDEDTILEASKIIMKRSKAQYVVLKLGSRGCSIWDGKNLNIIPAYKSNVVDTTAAGDCFTAALALEYKKSGDIFAACDMANKAGAIAVSRMGAESSMPSADDLINFKE